MTGFDCLVQKPQNEVNWHLCRGAGQPQEPWYASQFGQFGLWVRALLLKVLDFSPFIKIKYFQCMLEIHFLLRRPHYILTRLRWWGKISAVKLHKLGTSLVVQWLRVHLPIQGTRVRSMVQEGPTCSGATKAHDPQLLSPCPATTEVQVPQSTCSAKREASTMRSRPIATRE